MHAAIIAPRSWELLHACRTGRLEPVFFESVLAARHWLGEAEDVRCVVVDHQTEGLESFLSWLRGHPRWMSTPVIALVEAPRTQTFVHVLAAGADDAVAHDDSIGLAERLTAVAKHEVKRPEAFKGQALVAHPDAGVRRLVGRYLRYAGFDPTFAATEDEIVERAPECRLVVASIQGLDPVAVVGRLQATDAPTPIVWLTPDEDAGPVRSLFAGRSSVAVSPQSAPSDNLLFRVNELLAGDAINARDSRRLLVSTICAYRPAGARVPVHGLTYNISRSGLYVRSLAPLARGTDLWFELQPTPEASWIHLRGEVVWARYPSDTAGVPCGFGVQIREAECSPRDLQVWLDAYATLLEQDEAELTHGRPTLPAPIEMGAVG